MERVIKLNADMFPFPGAWGFEWIGLRTGRDFLVLLLLFAWCWFLDWASEEARERFSRRKLDLMATVVSFVVLVGGFALAAGLWLGVVCKSEYAKIQYLAQTTSNLSPLECALVLAAGIAVSGIMASVRRSGIREIRPGAAQPRAENRRETRIPKPESRYFLRRLSPFLFAAVPLVAAVWFCVSQYSVKPPRVRSVPLVFAEAVGIVLLGAAVLALTARPVWRRRTSPIRGGHWKRFVPRVFWLVFLASFLRGAGLLVEARAIARVSAGEVVGKRAAKPEKAALPPPETRNPPPSGFDLQAAIDAAPAGAVLDVPPGVYPPICTRGRAITLRAVEGPERTVVDASPLRAEGATNRCATLVSPRLASRHEVFFGLMQFPHQLSLGWMLPKMGEDRAPQPAPPGGASRLVGFTLRGGHADCGGGAFGGTLENCVLEGNLAEFCGGGAFGSRLVRCTVRGNVAAWMGGGAWGGSSEGCTVTNNAAGDFGGGVWGGVHAGLSATGNHARHHPDTAATAPVHAAP